jgi:hypothetical protein
MHLSNDEHIDRPDGTDVVTEFAQDCKASPAKSVSARTWPRRGELDSVLRAERSTYSLKIPNGDWGIKASDRATHEFLSCYLESMLDLYQKAQDSVRTRLSEAKRAVSSPLEFVRHLAGQPWPKTAEGSEVERLHPRVEELEARLAELAKPARRAARRQRR